MLKGHFYESILGLTIVDWATINRRIALCKQFSNPESRLNCLLRLFQETNDGMVAYAIGEELKSQSKLEEAIKYFEEARRLFPLEKYKAQAKAAIQDIASILKNEEATRLKTLSNKEESYKISVDLESEDPSKVLFIVSCTRRKIWDELSNTPVFVPARFAYKGGTFKKFLLWAEQNHLEERGFRWLILSAKYGFIEPWHPICNYNITFNDEETGPITDDSLYNQAMYQCRWNNIKLRDFRKVIFFGDPTYKDKVCVAFKDIQIKIVDGFTGETIKDITDENDEEIPLEFTDYNEEDHENHDYELPYGYEDILHPEGEGDYDSDIDFII